MSVDTIKISYSWFDFKLANSVVTTEVYWKPGVELTTGFLRHNFCLVIVFGPIFPSTGYLLNKHLLSWKWLQLVLSLEGTPGERIAQKPRQGCVSS